jgi:hypothetical protein
MNRAGRPLTLMKTVLWELRNDLITDEVPETHIEPFLAAIDIPMLQYLWASMHSVQRFRTFCAGSSANRFNQEITAY